MKNIFQILCCGGVLLAVGCTGASGPKLAPADGTVTYLGKPLAGATVMFVPDNGPLATGTTDLEGKFTLATGANPGVTVGPAKVTITANPPGQDIAGSASVEKRPQTPEESAAYMKKAEEMQRAMASGQISAAPGKSMIPDSYSKVQTSGLSFVVKSDGANHFEIPLK